MDITYNKKTIESVRLSKPDEFAQVAFVLGAYATHAIAPDIDPEEALTSGESVNPVSVAKSPLAAIFRSKMPRTKQKELIEKSKGIQNLAYSLAMRAQLRAMMFQTNPDFNQPYTLSGSQLGYLIDAVTWMVTHGEEVAARRGNDLGFQAIQGQPGLEAIEGQFEPFYGKSEQLRMLEITNYAAVIADELDLGQAKNNPVESLREIAPSKRERMKERINSLKLDPEKVEEHAARLAAKQSARNDRTAAILREAATRSGEVRKYIDPQGNVRRG